jgi:hypothetical protein
MFLKSIVPPHIPLRVINYFPVEIIKPGKASPHYHKKKKRNGKAKNGFKAMNRCFLGSADLIFTLFFGFSAIDAYF